jgi:hypothetical protein
VGEQDGEPPAGPLVRLAAELFGDYQRDRDLDALRAAVNLFRDARALALLEGSPDIAAYHNNLAYALHELAQATGDAATQAEAVRCHRAALAATDPGDPDRTAYLCTLSSGLRDLYRFTRDPGLLREAVAAAREAIALGGPVPSRATQYAVLGGASETLYEHAAAPGVLSEVIAAYRQAVTWAQADGDPGLAGHYGSLAGWLSERFERSGDVAALTEALLFDRKAVAESTGDDYLRRLSNLANTLRLRYERTADLTALTESAAAARMAVRGTAPGHEELPRRAGNLAAALLCRYERTGDVAALAEALTAARQAVAAAAPDDERRGGYLNNLHQALELEWRRTGDMPALTESVRVARQAAVATPPGHRLRAMCLTALASATEELYDRTGDAALLAESVQASRDAVAAVPAGDPDHALYLGNLGSALHTLFARTGDVRALDEAIHVTREALAARPADDPGRVIVLASLSSLLTDLATRTGHPGALTEAVDRARAAVAAVAPDDPMRAAVLDDLRSALTSLFVRTRNSAALLEAVRAGEEALAATPDGHLSRIAQLVNLAGSVQTLATRTDDLDASVRAAGLLAEALDTLPEDHPDRVLCEHNLARIYATFYWRFRDPEFLDKAIEHATDALAATPADHADHADRPNRLNTLSRLLMRRGAVSQDPAQLEQAVLLARQAVAATALEDPDHATFLNQLGLALYHARHSRVVAGGETAAVSEAWQCVYDAARHPAAPAGLRIGAYRRAAELAAAVGRTPQEALACIEAAVDLLPGVLPGQLDRADQEYEIGSVAHLAAHAAETAVTAGRPDRAVELLERTRGVLAAGELDRLTGHDHGRPLTIREIGAIAADGPVVYVYSGLERCDALIVTSDQDTVGMVRLIPLAITGADVSQRAMRLLALVGTEPDEDTPDPGDPAAQREILDILGWLRERVTGPVLAALGRDGTREGAGGLRRIWWCPVGEFAFLPLHAACLDEAVSSYATTARGLRYARSRPRPRGSAASAPLVVAVPGAPGAPPLPGAGLEADVIAGILPRALRLERPTKAAVLAALPDHPVAHFACHAAVDAHEPGRSQLLLDDHAEDPLTVGDIGVLRLAGGLAFLSACETALTSETLANEGVHITGAFQMAGYQHVVGTLWQVSDLASVDVVSDFYASLSAPGRPGVIDVSGAAVALHRATCGLRDRYPGWPALWASHIHTGP